MSEQPERNLGMVIIQNMTKRDIVEMCRDGFSCMLGIELLHEDAKNALRILRNSGRVLREQELPRPTRLHASEYFRYLKQDRVRVGASKYLDMQKKSTRAKRSIWETLAKLQSLASRIL